MNTDPESMARLWMVIYRIVMSYEHGECTKEEAIETLRALLEER